MMHKNVFFFFLACVACSVVPAQNVDELQIPVENDNQFPPENPSEIDDILTIGGSGTSVLEESEKTITELTPRDIEPVEDLALTKPSDENNTQTETTTETPKTSFEEPDVNVEATTLNSIDYDLIGANENNAVAFRSGLTNVDPTSIITNEATQDSTPEESESPKTSESLEYTTANTVPENITETETTIVPENISQTETVTEPENIPQTKTTTENPKASNVLNSSNFYVKLLLDEKAGAIDHDQISGNESNTAAFGSALADVDPISITTNEATQYTILGESGSPMISESLGNTTENIDPENITQTEITSEPPKASFEELVVKVGATTSNSIDDDKISGNESDTVAFRSALANMDSISITTNEATEDTTLEESGSPKTSESIGNTTENIYPENITQTETTTDLPRASFKEPDVNVEATTSNSIDDDLISINENNAVAFRSALANVDPISITTNKALQDNTPEESGSTKTSESSINTIANIVPENITQTDTTIVPENITQTQTIIVPENVTHTETAIETAKASVAELNVKVGATTSNNKDDDLISINDNNAVAFRSALANMDPISIITNEATQAIIPEESGDSKISDSSGNRTANIVHENITQTEIITETPKASTEEPDVKVGATTSNSNGGGVSKSVIGIIVAAMVVIVAAITIKKNWSSIKKRFSSNPRPANERNGVNTNGGRLPEEVPLQEKLPV